jgi:Mg2+ and Co2+ transporter CorA
LGTDGDPETEKCISKQTEFEKFTTRRVRSSEERSVMKRFADEGNFIFRAVFGSLNI